MISITQKNISHKSQYILLDIKKLELNSYVPFDIFIKKDDGFVVIIKVGTLLLDDIYNKLLNQDKLYVSAENHATKGRRIISNWTSRFTTQLGSQYNG
jgi:hypothetical protein